MILPSDSAGFRQQSDKSGSIAIAAGAICSVWFYFKGRRDERCRSTK